MSEDGDRKLSILKQEIDQQLRLANDNLIRSEEKTKNVVDRIEKAQAARIQKLYEMTEFKISQHNQEL